MPYYPIEVFKGTFKEIVQQQMKMYHSFTFMMLLKI